MKINIKLLLVNIDVLQKASDVMIADEREYVSKRRKAHDIHSAFSLSLSLPLCNSRDNGVNNPRQYIYKSYCEIRGKPIRKLHPYTD